MLTGGVPLGLADFDKKANAEHDDPQVSVQFVTGLADAYNQRLLSSL